MSNAPMMIKGVSAFLLLLFCCLQPTAAQDLDAKYATELLKPGTLAPDFKLKTLEGKSFKLSSLRGQYVVLDCWASWCPDCRKDIPNVLRLYQKFHDKGVAFVGLSFDTDHDKWQEAVTRYALPYLQVSELKRMKESPVAQAYGVRWIPSLYLIDPEGKVVLGTVLSDKLERTLYERLARPFVPNAEQLTIDGSKGRLSAVIQKPVLQPGEQCPMVMLCHGFNGNKEAKLLTLVADSLQARGIASIRFDFNGHGKSEGDFQEMTVPNELEDARKVFEYVRDLRYVSKVAIAGHSQGGVVAAMTAGQLPQGDVSAVALFAPAGVIPDDAIRGLRPDMSFNPHENPLDPPEYIELWGGLKLGRDYIKTAQTLSIYPTAQHYQGPAIIIHGTADRVVPFTYGQRFHEIWPSSQLVILPAFDHGFSQCVYRVADLATDFLVSVLKE